MTKNATKRTAELTAQEKNKIAELGKPIAAIDGHFQETRAAFLEAWADESIDRYLANPTDEKFSILKEAMLEQDRARRIPKLSAMPGHALERLVTTEIRPFLEPIVERFHSCAKANLAAVTESESKKHFELTGLKQPFTSQAIEGARKSVQEIEEIRQWIFISDASLIKKALASLRDYSISETGEGNQA